MRTWIVVLLWACAHLSVDAISLSRGFEVRRKNKEIEVGKHKGTETLRRSKRGWMWKQFFLQEEYTGTDYQYIGKVRGSWFYSRLWCRSKQSCSSNVIGVCGKDRFGFITFDSVSDVIKQRMIKRTGMAHVGVSSVEPAGFKIRNRMKSDLPGPSQSSWSSGVCRGSKIRITDNTSAPLIREHVQTLAPDALLHDLENEKYTDKTFQYFFSIISVYWSVFVYYHVFWF